MRYRPLGKTGMQVSEIGYGAWGIGGKLWQGHDDAESLRSLERAIELGVNFIDTALVYGDGHSEQIVGQAVREAPGKVYVATKTPPKNMRWPAIPGVPIGEVFPYAHIIETTEQSLRNLNLETIDLQQFHVWDPGFASSDEWRRAVEDLKRSGKIQAFGISINDHQPDTALEAIRTGLVDAVQVIYNIFDQSPERDLFPLCQELGVGVLARVPLDEGALTGNITPDTTFPEGDFRNRYFGGDRKAQVAERVRALQADVPGPLPELALRFVISHPAVSTVIPGMRKTAHVEANCEVSRKGPLDQETIGKLRRHAWTKNFYGAPA